MEISDVVNLRDLDRISEAVSEEFEDVDRIKGESLDAVGEESGDDLRLCKIRSDEGLLLEMDHLLPIEEGAKGHDGNVT